MRAYTTPGVYLERQDRSAGPTVVRTDVAAFVGIAERGPLHRPIRVESFEQFRTVFGDPVAEGYLAYVARAYFENGGRTAWFVRIAAEERSGELDPGVPQPADRRASILASTGGFVPGAVVTFRQERASVASAVVEAVDATTRTVHWDRPLPNELDLADPVRPIEVLTGAGRARHLLAGPSGMPTFLVEAASEGRWGDRLAVTVDRRQPSATRTTVSPSAPLAGEAFVRSIVGFEPNTLVRIFQAPSTEAYAVVASVDAASGRLTWRSPPAGVDPDRPYDLEAVELSLEVRLGGRPVLQVSGLSVVPDHPRYLGTVFGDGASPWIRMTALTPGTPIESSLPEPVTGAGLRGGRDGLAAITPLTFTGDPVLEERWGLRTLETVDEPAVLAIPDIHVQPPPAPRYLPLERPSPDPCLPGPRPEPVADPPPPPPREFLPALDDHAVFEVQLALIRHCESMGDRFALLDPPRGSGATEAGEPDEVRAWRGRFDTAFAALLYPWVVVAEPRAGAGEPIRALPPSGHVAGLYAHAEISMGVHHPPANLVVAGATGLTCPIDDALQGVLNPLGIDCLRALPGRGLRLYGARTLSSRTPWRFVNVRRLMSMIVRSLRVIMQWAVFEPHDALLRQKVVLTITSLLTVLWSRGALVGASPEEAFFVKCDAENNPADAVARGELLAEIGVAPVRPAEFIVLRIGRVRDSLEITEA